MHYIPIISLSIVEDILKDQGLSPADIDSRIATLSAGLQTPVPTGIVGTPGGITPVPTLIPPGTVVPTAVSTAVPTPIPTVFLPPPTKPPGPPPFVAAPSIYLIKNGSWNDVNSNTYADVGETINYTFAVTNNGNVTLTNITLTDPSATISGGPIASLAPAAADNTTFSGSYTITQADINAGSFSNTASVTGQCAGASCPVSNPDSDTITLPQNPSIALTKNGTWNDTNSNSRADVGETISYTFTVTNNGNISLTNITLADTLGGVTISGGPIASLAPAATDNTTFTGSYTITAGDITAGTFVNTATVTGQCAVAGCPVSNPDNESVALPHPSISLSKSGIWNDINSSGFADAGETIDYTFTVTNTGNVTLTNVTLADTVGGVTISGGPIASLAPSASDNTTFSGSYTITAADVIAGSFFNTATVTGQCAVAACPVSDPDDDTVALPQNNPSIFLSKSGTWNDTNSNTFADVGETINYIFTVSNTGNSTLTNITLVDTVGGVTILGGPIVSLAPAAADNTTFTGSYAITQNDINTGSFFNTATVTGQCVGVGCPVSNPDNETVTLPQNPSIALTKTGFWNDTISNGYADVGETISFTFTVTNNGNVPLTNITLVDTVGGVTISGGPILSLAPSASDNTTFTGSYTITQADINAGSFSNTATVTGQCAVAGCPVSIPDSENVTLPQNPSIALTKTGGWNDNLIVNGIPDAGETITYTFNVTNDGNVPLTNITLADTVGGVTISGGPIASLAPTAVDSTTFSASYTITQADINAGSFFNTATVTGQCAPAGCPVLDPASENVTLPQTPSIALTKTGSWNDNVIANGIPDAGETITYTFNVTNNGNIPLTNVTLADTIGGVTISGGPIALLAPAASDNTTFSGSYTITQVDINTGSFFNTATVTGQCATVGCPVLDPDNETVTLTQSPSIVLTKSGTWIDSNSSTYAEAGEIISYGFTVTNNGNIPLTNVVITDPSVTMSGGPIALLAPAASDFSTFSGSYTITAGDVTAGSFSNTATATGQCAVAGCPVADPDGDTVTLPSAPTCGSSVSIGTIQPESGGNKEITFTIGHSVGGLSCEITDMTNVTWNTGTNGSLKEIKIDHGSHGEQQIYPTEETTSPFDVSGAWKSGTQTYRTLGNGQTKTLIFLYDLTPLVVPYSGGGGNYSWRIHFDDTSWIDVSD